jgi:RimJ/RimL family protein N-acetyltransferase
MGLTLREVRDQDLPLLFEQWADPLAVHMAAFTAPDHMDRDAFERRWSRLRADETVLARVASRRVLEKCGFRVIATERNVAEARSAEIEELVLRLDELASPIGADHSPFGR